MGDSPVWVATAFQVIGVVIVSLGNSLDAQQRAQAMEAVSTLNELLSPHGTSLLLAGIEDAADIRINVGPTSACGGMADGVLGCEVGHGEITLIEGWNWFTDDQKDTIQSGQYDFQTIVTHELGHALGLSHSLDPNSVMYWKLPSGVARREFTPSDHVAVGLEACQQPKMDAGVAGDLSPKRAHEYPCTCPLCTGSSAPMDVGHLTTAPVEKTARPPATGHGEAVLFVVPDDTLDVGAGLVAAIDHDKFLFAVLTTKTSGFAATGDDVLVGGDGTDHQLGDPGRDHLIGGFATNAATLQMTIDREASSFDEELASPSLLSRLEAVLHGSLIDQCLNEVCRIP